ncbi:MAG: hypothetical protein WEB00_08390 [Dehalococcoidia bacterium]
MGIEPSRATVAAAELRRMFNEGGFLQRVETGELLERLLYEGRPSEESGETSDARSQVLEYVDSAGERIAVVHQYLRPDGTLGASGRPDPKLLVLESVVYRPERQTPSKEPKE